MMILGVKYKIVQNLTCLNSKFWVGWFFNFNRRPYTLHMQYFRKALGTKKIKHD